MRTACNTSVGLLVLCCLVVISVTAASRQLTGGQEEVTYVAAVVEYPPIYATKQVDRSGAVSIMMQNLDGYENAIKEAQVLNADLQVIVFPEDGLYSALLIDKTWSLPYAELIPDITNGAPYVNPCDDQNDDTPILHRASCLAKQYGVVLVLDMADKQPCTDDPNCADGYYLYNTQVAFSETGQLLAKYHKSHLYYEPEWDAGSQEGVYFDTSFGVRFGLFICFDVMFPYPQLSLMEDYGVRDIAYSTWWVNMPPYITATQTQQGWSRLFQVNMLAANAGTSWYNSGSGIYSNGEALQAFYNSGYQKQTKVLVSTVTTTRNTTLNSTPKTTSTTRAHSASTRVSSLAHPLWEASRSATGPTSDWVVKTFEATPGSRGTLSVTAGNLTCEAVYSISADTTVSQAFSQGQQKQRYDTWGVVALNGMYNNLYEAQACALMICPGAVQNATCTQYVMSGTTLFDGFAIKANFSQAVQQLALVASNKAELVDTDKYQVLPGALVSTSALKATSLINVGLFGPSWSS